MGPDILFENHSIKEIQEIEKKLRNDIERKKEELRQMVGERYRDLMEAADTITEMKGIAESVTECIHSLEDRCTQLQHGSLQKGLLSAIEQKVADRQIQNQLLYAVASQIKILMDAPTKIWFFIEHKDFLNAVSLFLLAKHTHSLLLLDPAYQEEKLFYHFPIINRQWTSISHLQYTLIQDSKHMLEIHSFPSKNSIGPLCCYCLLLGSDLEKILTEILKIRKDVIQTIFQPEKYTKTQISEFVAVVQTTLEMIHVAFYPEGEEEKEGRFNRLLQTLLVLTNKDNPGPISLLDIKSSEIFKFLPKAITEFRPSVTFPLEPCHQETLQAKCKQWLKDVQSEFQPALSNLLNYVNAVKSLANIRLGVQEQLTEMIHWDKVCDCLLKQQFSVWDYFLKDCFHCRIKEIIENHVKDAIEICQKDIEEILSRIITDMEESLAFEPEKNVSSYLWMDSSNDIMDNIAWIPSVKRNLWESGELSMKTLGFTPRIQSLCRDLDQKFQEAIEDVSYYSLSFENQSIAESELLLLSRKLCPISEEAIEIFRYLNAAAEKYLFDLASYFETKLLYLQHEKGHNRSSRVVFVGHLCRSITQLCPHLVVCLSFENLCNVVNTMRDPQLNRNSTLTTDSEMWKELKHKFLDNSELAFKSWSECQTRGLLHTFDTEFDVGSLEGLLKSLLQWDKVEIQEESEQGTSVKSVLRIPQHVSLPLSNALYMFCCQMNAIGGHTISSLVRSHISKELLIGLLEIYKRKINSEVLYTQLGSRLIQIQSLQIVFDVQFLVGLMAHKDNHCEQIINLSQVVINKAVSFVDPFDMDVFATPLQQNLKKGLQKSLLLFGLIACPEQVSYLHSIKAHSITSQIEHNIMLSSSNSSRFPLLPLTTRTNMINPFVPEVNQLLEADRKESESKKLQSHGSSPNLCASDTQTNPLKSTSFYDRVTAMSSSWFGN